MKFSIITCTYNSEKYLQENIKSVKNQAFRDFEHVFIDGFSTDKTMEMIEIYRKEFPDQVKIFQFKPKGIANAMNRGIEKSSGKYLIHLHSDDNFYSNDVLEKVSNFIEKNNQPDWIYGKANFMDTETNVSRVIPHRGIYHKIKFWLLLLTNYIPHQAVFLKKTVFDKYGVFDENLKNSMDYELWLRLAKKNITSLFIDCVVCNFSVRENSQSALGKNICLEENKLVKENFVQNRLIRLLLNLIDNINFRRNIL